MKSATFDNLTSGIKNIAIVLALIAGGFWTVGEFRDWHNVKLKVELNNVIIRKAEDNQHYYVSCNANVINLGNRDVDLVWVDNENKEVSGFIASKIKYNGINQLKSEITTIDFLNKRGRLRSLVSVGNGALFVFDSPGYYLIKFFISVDYNKYKSCYDTREPDLIKWKAEKIIYVE